MKKVEFLMKKATRAALYERVSHDEQSKFGFSIQNQVERLTKYAEENNLQIVEHYTDEGYSAGSMKRPALQRMLNDLHKFDVIIFTKLDRFTRNVLDANEMVKILDREGVAIRAIDEEDVDTTTADGMFMFNLKVSLAQRELKKGSERILTVFDYKVKHGQPISGGVTFGYKIATVGDGTKRVVKNEEEAHIVEDMFDYFLKHQSIRQTALYINDKYDLNFAYLTYNRFFKREIYAGVYRGNTEYCEPYISRKTFERVQEVIKSNIRVRKNNNVYLFSGLITCPKCGRRLTGICVENQYKVKYAYYRCDSSQMRHKCDFKSLREEEVEEFILQNINRLANEYICEASVEIDKKPKPKIDIKEIQEEIDLLNYQFRKKRISVKEYDHEYEQLEKRLAEAKREMPEEADLSGLQSFLNSGWENVYHALEKTDRRALLRSVIKEIEIDIDRNIDVRFL
jgi:DNA invertase Pin-like site-specific DNA recombinase